MSTTTQMQDVAVFWDYENCPVPFNVSGYAVVSNICALALAYGTVKSLKAYLGIAEQTFVPRAVALRSELQSSGVSLVDCPHNGRKDVADKMIMIDMLAHAIDNPAPSTVMIITGDRDFAYAMSILKLRRYRVVLVTLNNAHPSLTSQASQCYDWNTEILDPVAMPGKGIKSSLGVAEGSMPDKNSTSSKAAMPTNNAASTPHRPQSSPQDTVIANSSHDNDTNDFDAQLEDVQLDPEQEANEPSSISREDIEDLIQNIRRLSSVRRVRSGSKPQDSRITGQENAMSTERGTAVNQKLPLVAESSQSKASSCRNIGNGWHDSVGSAPLGVPPSVDLPKDQPTCPPAFLQRPASAPGLIPFSVDNLEDVTPAAPTLAASSYNSISPLIASDKPCSPLKNGSTFNNTVTSSQSISSPTPHKSPPVHSSPSILPNDTTPGMQISMGQATTFSPSTANEWAPVVPDELKILVRALLRYKTKGTLRPLRSVLAGEVSQNNTFKKAGVEKFRDYIRLAQQRGLIDVGGQERESWIALKPKFYNVNV